MLKPNDDTEVWKFTNTQLDLPGVDAKAFKFVPINDKAWKFQEAQQPMGGGAAPAGGIVRPNAGGAPVPPGIPKK
jgi:hypothetical protein